MVRCNQLTSLPFKGLNRFNEAISDVISLCLLYKLYCMCMSVHRYDKHDKVNVCWSLLLLDLFTWWCCASNCCVSGSFLWLYCSWRVHSPHAAADIIHDWLAMGCPVTWLNCNHTLGWIKAPLAGFVPLSVFVCWIYRSDVDSVLYGSLSYVGIW